MGSDTAVVEPFSAFLRSGIWREGPEQKRGKEAGALAILALGLSHSPVARDILAEMLSDESQFPPLLLYRDFLWREHPAWPRLLGYGTSERTKAASELPASVVAAIALAELGDKSAMASIVKAAEKEPYLKKVYDETISGLKKAQQ